MSGDGLSKLIAKACFLAALTMTILIASNSEASLQVKLMKDSLLRQSQHN